MKVFWVRACRVITHSFSWPRDRNTRCSLSHFLFLSLFLHLPLSISPVSPSSLVNGFISEKWEPGRWLWYPRGLSSRWTIPAPTPLLTTLTSVSSLAPSEATTSSSPTVLPTLSLSSPLALLLPGCPFSLTSFHSCPSPCCTSSRLSSRHFPFVPSLLTPCLPYLLLPNPSTARSASSPRLSIIPPSRSICFFLTFWPTDLVHGIMGFPCGGYYCGLWQVCVHVCVCVCTMCVACSLLCNIGD